MSVNKYRIPELRSSLCGCSLETGTKIIGWIYLMLGALTVIGAILIRIGIAAMAESEKKEDNKEPKDPDLINFFVLGVGVFTWFLAFFGILQILMNLLLLKGVYQKKSSYIWPWVVAELVFEVFNLSFDLFFDYELEEKEAETSSVVSDVIAEVIGLVISLYCIWLVYSYYCQLKRQDDDLPAYESHVYAV